MYTIMAGADNSFPRPPRIPPPTHTHPPSAYTPATKGMLTSTGHALAQEARTPPVLQSFLSFLNQHKMNALSRDLIYIPHSDAAFVSLW